MTFQQSQIEISISLLEQLVNDPMGLVSKESLEKGIGHRINEFWVFC